MSKYVDGFVLVIPKDKVAAYKKMAGEGRDLWMKHGALAYYECQGDDLVGTDMGGVKPLEFTALTNASPNDTVWFSFIVFKSREHRDDVNARVMEEMHQSKDAHKDTPMPFDLTRMAYGGFEVAVEG